MDIILFEYLLAWTSAFVVIEIVANSFLWWVSKGTKTTINEYYNIVPTHIVVFGDYLYSTLIFLLALAVFRYVTKKQTIDLKNALLFVVVFVAVQWTLDLTWALVVKTLISNNISNKYLDFFNRYANEVGIKAVLGDMLYGLCWLLLFAVIYKTFGDIPKYFLIILGLFIVVIMSYT
jgi:hypothetical protein